jgi:hypothetical protein
MFVLVSLLFPALYLQTVPLEDGSILRGVFDIGVFSLATMSASVFYVASQVELLKDWRSAMKYLPVLMAIGVGMSLSNARAVLEALFGHKSEFVRTPKYGQGRRAATDSSAPRKRKRNWLPYVEFGFGLYMTACAVLSLVHLRSAMTTPFLVIFAFGFFYVSLMSFQTQRASEAAPRPVGEPAGK